MKIFLSFSIFVLLFVIPAYSSSDQALCEGEMAAKADSTLANPAYDAVLAEKLGADAYGMKSYLLVMLKTGPVVSTDDAFVARCFRGHLDNINRLEKEGRLVVAGPLAKNDQQYRGIFILDVATTEEAAALLETDPALREGLLAADLYSWYGSAALPLYLEEANRIWKEQP
jgi:uncharacterized protein YciI